MGTATSAAPSPAQHATCPPALATSRRRFIEQDTHSLRAFLRRSSTSVCGENENGSTFRPCDRPSKEGEGDQIRPCPHSLTRGRGNRPKPDFRPTVWEREGGRERNKGSTEREGGGREGVCNCDTGRRVNSFPSQKAKFPLHPREAGCAKSIRILLLWTSWISRSNVDPPFDIVFLGDKMTPSLPKPTPTSRT